jgi:hypothetical protein
MNIIKYMLFGLLTFSCSISWAEELPNPDEENIANFHLLDETCAGQCHEGEEPSEDLEFEYRSCVECHDTLANLDGRQHNIKHQDSEQMECVECHFPHEESDPKEMCTDCHEEEDEELEGFYSMQLERYLNLYSDSPKFVHPLINGAR